MFFRRLLFLYILLFLNAGHAVEIGAAGGDVSGGSDFSVYSAGGGSNASLTDLIHFFAAGADVSGGGNYFRSKAPEDVLRYYKEKIPAPVSIDLSRIQSVGSDATSIEAFQKSLVRATQLQEKGFTGKGQSVVIIDSGISPTFRGIEQVTVFKDYIGNCSLEAPCDGQSHGTFVADIVHQIAPKVNLIIIRVLDSNAKGDTDNIVKAIKWTIKNRKKFNIRAINLSVSKSDGPIANSYDWRDELRSSIANATKKGIQVVACAGNQGENLDVQSVPANTKEAFVAGSIYHNFTESRLDDKISPFTHFGYARNVESSSFGFWSSVKSTSEKGEVKPNVFAPGELVLAQMDINSSTYQRIFQGSNRVLEGGLALLNGTSFASPFVVGGIALLGEAFPEASTAQIRVAIEKTVYEPPVENLVTHKADGSRISRKVQTGMMNLLGAYQYLKKHFSN